MADGNESSSTLSVAKRPRLWVGLRKQLSRLGRTFRGLPRCPRMPRCTWARRRARELHEGQQATPSLRRSSVKRPGASRACTRSTQLCISAGYRLPTRYRGSWRRL